MLSCENITSIRNNKVLFQGLGFCLQEGALLLLKGPNGSGKTSLLDILSASLGPQSGEVSWNGTTIRKKVDFKHDMLAIGHIGSVHPKVTVEKRLKSYAKKFGTEMLIPAALKFYDLESFKDVRAGELSAGWQRRLALATLIVAPCKLWLLDEPTDFLDEDAVLLTVSLIETRVKQGGIVIAASHSLRSGDDTHVLDLQDFKP